MWHIWTIDDWEKNIDLTREGHRTGLRLRFDKDIDSMQRICRLFAKRIFFSNPGSGLYKKCQEAYRDGWR